jgi:hypothetical protein
MATPMEIDDSFGCHLAPDRNNSGVLSLDGLDLDDVRIQIASDLHGEWLFAEALCGAEGLLLPRYDSLVQDSQLHILLYVFLS